MSISTNVTEVNQGTRHDAHQEIVNSFNPSGEISII